MDLFIHTHILSKIPISNHIYRDKYTPRQIHRTGQNHFIKIILHNVNFHKQKYFIYFHHHRRSKVTQFEMEGNSQLMIVITHRIYIHNVMGVVSPLNRYLLSLQKEKGCSWLYAVVLDKNWWFRLFGSLFLFPISSLIFCWSCPA